MADNKSLWFWAVVIIIAILLLKSCGSTTNNDRGASVTTHLYNAEQNEISLTQATVNGYQFVQYVSFDVTITNSGEFPLTNVEDTTGTATQIPYTWSQRGVTSLAIGQSTLWKTNLINIDTLGVGSKTANFIFTATYIHPQQGALSLTKSASTTLNIATDPIAGFDVTITSPLTNPS